MTRLKRSFRRIGFMSLRKKSTFFLLLLFGIIIGFILSSIARHYFLFSSTKAKPVVFDAVVFDVSKPVVSTVLAFQVPHLKPETRPGNLSTELTGSKGFILIAIMTADHLLASRAKTIYKTWGRNLTDVKIIFFCGETRNTSVDFTVVNLPGVDDGYPPQRKSFRMLKYVHDNFIDHFYWFVRADDDVYIRPDPLMTLLRTFDSSEDVLIGQSGVGKVNERGKLGLAKGDNFCLGGPGVVMSASVLRKVAPYLLTCLNETATFHEDVEVGRCIRKHVGVLCPWAQESRHLFHQMFGNALTVLSGSLDKNGISRAITVHPVKEPSYMYRLHFHFLSSTVQLLQDRRAKLHQRRERVKMLLSARRNKTEGFEKAQFYGRLPRNSSSHWESFDLQNLYGLSEHPVSWIGGRTQQAVRKFLVGVVNEINAQAKKVLGTPVEYKKMSLGSVRVYAPLGVQYTVGLETLRKTSLPNAAKTPLYSRHYMHFQQSFAPLVKRTVVLDGRSLVVHFIVPLLKRFNAFLRFLDSFEESFIMQGKPVALLIIYFPNVSSPEQHKDVFEKFRAKHPKIDLRWSELAGNFSRARALELGTKSFGNEALLFFADVDLVFTAEFYHRCRANAIPGHSAYFPTMFSQFNPRIVYHNRTRPPANSRVLTKRTGTWRKYSFGPACVYAGDVRAVGGLDTSIRGWGLEDMDFYEKCLKHGLDVFRSPDLGLLHGYHPQTSCADPKMNALQAKMCEDSKLQGLASAESLVDYILFKGYV